MSALTPADKRRVLASAGLLQSDKAGEVAGAAHAIGRILQKGNLDLPGVIRRGLIEPAAAPAGFGAIASRPQHYDTPARHQVSVRMCQAIGELLTEWEQEFLASIAGQRRLSEKQRDRLKAIEAKIERRRAK